MNSLIGAGAPVDYQALNIINASYSPSEIHIADSKLARFFRRYLLQKAMSRFEFGLPSWWDRDYFRYTLFCWGYEAVVKTDKFGVIPQGCSLTGYNVFYRPTKAVISNPLIRGILQPEIGRQCTIIRLMPDYGGIMDLVGYYADMMALTASTAETNILNSKLAFGFAASDKAAAESFKRIYDNFASGEPAVVFDKKLLGPNGEKSWDYFTQNLKENYIAGDLLQDLRKWEDAFDTAIGIANANTEKKERMIVDEVNANNEETKSLVTVWLETLEEGFEATRQMFGLGTDELWVKLREISPVEAPETNGGYNDIT